MKTVFLCLLFASITCSFNAILQAEEIRAESHITEVMVYPDSAAVTRKASLELQPGEYKIVFPDVIPNIDRNSLQASLSEEAPAVLFGAQMERKHLKTDPSERVQKKKDKIQKLEDEVARFNNFNAVLSEKKEFIESFRVFSQDQTSKDLTTRIPEKRELEQILDFIDTNLSDVYEKELKNEKKIRSINTKIRKLRAELQELSRPRQKLKHQITVDLHVIEEGSFDIGINYLAQGAFWRPVYDARVDIENNMVEFIQYGTVKQNTGEDWEDVSITLSTARATVGGKMPQVTPWFIRQYQPPRRRARAMEDQVDLMAASPESIQPDMAARREDVKRTVYVRAEERGTAVVYNIPRSATVKSDGSEYKLPVSKENFSADLEYSAYPRRAPKAYLRSKVTNSADQQFLAGEVNTFLSGDFVGSSSIDTISPNEEFTLYLGMDENVRVDRERISKKVDDLWIGGISSRTIKTIMEYKLTVENYKNMPIRAVIYDSLPVSQDERIEVDIVDVSVDPDEKDWEDKRGVWRWEMDLEPTEKKEIHYTIIIEHARDIKVQGI